MKITIKDVHGIVRQSEPDENTTITDDLNFHWIPYEKIKEINIYKRSKDVCPFNRGNWMIEIIMDNDEEIAIKLPLTMTREAILRYSEPLIKEMEKLRINK